MRVTVCKGGGGPGGVGSWVIVSEFSDAWGKRGEGGARTGGTINIK